MLSMAEGEVLRVLLERKPNGLAMYEVKEADRKLSSKCIDGQRELFFKVPVLGNAETGLVT